MTVPTSAVVLPADEGSRLRPLTQYEPKPMLHVAVGRSEQSREYGTVCLGNGRVTTILEEDPDSEQEVIR